MRRPSLVCMWIGACLVLAPSWAADQASRSQARHESKLALPIAGVDHLVRAPAPERPLKTWRYADVDGEHLLVVHKTPLPQEGTARGQAKVEHHALKVTDFLEKKGEQVVNWQIKESVDCPGLDSEAEFFLDRVSITDLNQDGRMEVTVPYKTFCGGGVEPKTIKIILRSGPAKFALRGESKMVLPDGSSMGGSMKLDRDLDLPANAALKRHVLDLWQAISVARF